MKFNHNLKSKELKVSSGEIICYYDNELEKETLVLIHGLMVGKDSWIKFMHEIKDEYRIIAPQIPEEAKNISLHYYADLIHLFCQELGVHKFHLIGHSMGGQISTILTKLFPHSVLTLVLLAPAGFEVFNQEEKNIIQNSIAHRLKNPLNENQIKQNFNLNFFGNKTPEDAQFLYKERIELLKNDPNYSQLLLNESERMKTILEEPVLEILPIIKQQTLIIFGKQDLLIPHRLLHSSLTMNDIADLGQDLLVNSELHILDKCGHFIPWEHPKRIAELFRIFIANYIAKAT